MVRILSASVLLALAACRPPVEDAPVKPIPTPAKLSDAEWRANLTPEQYHVCRQRGTEAPGSGKYLHETRDGRYQCVACGTSLFRSETKYAACDWPSFFDALPGAVATRPDRGALEAVCARCDSHLGHLFDDGPPPTGKRY